MCLCELWTTRHICFDVCTNYFWLLRYLDNRTSEPPLHPQTIDDERKKKCFLLN